MSAGGSSCRTPPPRAAGACSRPKTSRRWPSGREAAGPPRRRLATVTTSTTQLRDDGPVYRGTPATELATTVPYEQAAELLWRGDPRAESGERDGSGWEPVALDPPTTLGASDRLRWAVVMAGAGDRLRSDLRPASVVAVARRLVATMVAVLPGPRTTATVPALELGPNRWEHTVAGALTARLAPEPGTDLVRAVNAALILLADHELATSTVAVRVAASARANLYDAVLAGLGVVAGPLHGGHPSWPTAWYETPRRSAPSVPSTKPCAGNSGCRDSDTRSIGATTLASRC